MLSLKGVLGTLLTPLPCALLLVSLGLLIRVTGRLRLARALIWSGALIALAASLGPVSSAMLLPLEGRYPATLDASRLQPQPHFIAVLGSGYRARPGWPVTAALGADAVLRLTEGVRLFRQLPGSVLILSGGTSGEEQPAARGYLLAAKALGVPESAILVNDTPVDTAEEIRAIRARVGLAPVLLVTEAFHMTRAMAQCERLGVHAIPAPTGQLVDAHPRWGFGSFIPSGRSLHNTELALHEYLGLFAMRFGVE